MPNTWRFGTGLWRRSGGRKEEKGKLKAEKEQKEAEQKEREQTERGQTDALRSPKAPIDRYHETRRVGSH